MLGSKASQAMETEISPGDSAAPPVTGPQAFPASFAQQRLWFLHQYSPDSPVYHAASAFRFRGEVRLEPLQRALTDLVERHESLRTTFGSEGGEVRQHIHPPADVELPVETVADEADLSRRLAQEALRPFDLDRGPLFRPKVFQVAGGDTVLLLGMHHIVTDGWSTGVLTRDLQALYGARVTGGRAELPELPIQYADFAVWQREWLQGEVLEEQLKYWTGRLASAPRQIQLPVDRPYPAEESMAGAFEEHLLDPGLGAAVEALARREGVTLFMLLLAAFQVLLRRHGAEEEVVVASPMAGRTREELENLVGFFVNTLVFPTRLDGNPTFQDVLRRVRETALGAMAHHDLPFEKLVERLVTMRDPGRAPLVQVVFALQNFGGRRLRLGDAEAEWIRPEVPTSHFELGLFATPEPSGLRLRLEYRTALFNPGTIRSLLRRMETLLRGVTADPAGRLWSLPLLPEAEQRLLLEDFNATQVPYPRSESVPAVFERVASAHPESVAVVDEGRRITYRELRIASERMADRLRQAGVGQGSLVGLHLERSSALVAAVLGVLRAGGAYAPLPIEYPAERLAFMLGDLGSSVVITDRDLPEGVTGPGVRVLDLRQGWPGEPGASEDGWERAPMPGPLDPAYVMYTSGSTGRPKGVVVPHRAILRLVLGTDFLPWGPGLRFLLLAPTAFDASTLELWGPLLHGGTVVVFRSRVPDLAELERAVADGGVNCLWLTAGLFNRVIEDRPGVLRPVRHLLTGGEVLSPAHVDRALAALPEVNLVNGYGPTESTTFATTFHIGRSPGGWAGQAIPIGRPIANTVVRVVDEQGGLAPLGVVGELLVGGDGLALGYVGDPELTGRRFVPDRWARSEGARLYRTGDRCRWREDGVLEFLGRLDDQLKVRGNRIEPGEVEAALATHPGVASAAVVGRPTPAGVLELVAVVVPRPGAGLQADGLREFLEARLPRPMVPTVFEQRDALPLSANGKVDRRGLVQGAGPVLGAAAPAVEARTGTERRLQEIWRELLPGSAAGVHDNFFDSGGHSLLAMQLLAAIANRMGGRLRLVDLFQNPTIAGLAARLDADGETDAVRSRPQVVLDPSDRSPGLRGASPGAPLFHVPGRAGFEFLTPTLAHAVGELRPYFDGLQFPGMEGGETVPEDGRVIAADLIRQVERIWPEGPLVLSGHSWGGAVAFEMACQLAESGRNVEQVILFDSIVPGSSERLSWWETARIIGRRAASQPRGQRWSYLAKLVRSRVAGTVARQRSEGPVVVDAQSDTAARWRATEPACERLRLRPYAGSVVLFEATGYLPNEGLRSRRQPLNGWGELVRGPLKVYTLDCLHNGVFMEPVHPGVMAGLREVLASGPT